MTQQALPWCFCSSGARCETSVMVECCLLNSLCKACSGFRLFSSNRKSKASEQTVFCDTIELARKSLSSSEKLLVVILLLKSGLTWFLCFLQFWADRCLRQKLGLKTSSCECRC